MARDWMQRSTISHVAYLKLWNWHCNANAKSRTTNFIFPSTCLPIISYWVFLTDVRGIYTRPDYSAYIVNHRLLIFWICLPNSASLCILKKCVDILCAVYGYIDMRMRFTSQPDPAGLSSWVITQAVSQWCWNYARGMFFISWFLIVA